MGLEKIIQFGKNVLPFGKPAKKFMKAVGTVSLIAALASTPAFASEKYDKPNKNKNEIYQEVILGNCVLQGVISGFGGMQNGKPYWESFAKGCFGGALVAGGKIAVGNDLNAAWPAKLATATGTSIVYNVSNGKPISDSFGIDFGPAYFELKKNEFGNYKFKAYVLPDSLGYLLFDLSEGDRIDWNSSLKYGTPILLAEKINYPIWAFAVTGANNLRVLNEKEYADAFECEKNVFNCSPDPYKTFSKKEVKKEREKTIRHEMIHTHQYTSTRTFGNVLLNTFDSFKSFNGVEMKIKERLLEPLYINLDHFVGDYISSFALGYITNGNDSFDEREAYRLSNGEKKTN